MEADMGTGTSEQVWLHCSPALLDSGVSCAETPRRVCECDFFGSHDHLVSRLQVNAPKRLGDRSEQ